MHVDMKRKTDGMKKGIALLSDGIGNKAVSVVHEFFAAMPNWHGRSRDRFRRRAFLGAPLFSLRAT